MHVSWHLTRWWDCCMPEDEKKGIESILIDKKLYLASGIASTKINTLLNYQFLNEVVA